MNTSGFHHVVEHRFYTVWKVCIFPLLFCTEYRH